MFSPPVANQGIKNGTTGIDSMYSGSYKNGQYCFLSSFSHFLSRLFEEFCNPAPHN